MRFLYLFAACGGSFAFSFSATSSPSRTSTQLSASSSVGEDLRRWAVASVFAVAVVAAPAAFADEIGVDKDAPTLFTGETVEICIKRGPLGACLKTEMRTDANENDVAKKYFREPSELVKMKEASMRADSDEGNALIDKLRQQSVDNKEKNDLYVERKTFEADQSATFGPFGREILVMNTDGKTYTLLQNPVAMRLKKDGFINDKREFLKQPTQEDLDAAEVEPEDGGGFLGGIFGGKKAEVEPKDGGGFLGGIFGGN